MEKLKLRVNMVSESEFTVQGHGVHTAYKELAAALQKRPDVEVAVNSFGAADITHLHTIGAYSLAHLLFGKGKKVISAHVTPDSFVGSLIAAKYWLPLAKVYLRWFYNRGDLVLAVSDKTKQDLVDLGVRREIEIFYNIIDTEQYRNDAVTKAKARQDLGIGAEEFVVVGAGQVQPRKRVDTMVELARQLPEMSFVWVGGMPFKRVAANYAEMQQMIERAPQNFTCTDVVPHEKVRLYLQAADVFILPSEQETFGLVVVEAAAAGLPVVLRDLPDYDETFRGDAVMGTEATFADDIRKLKDDLTYRDRMVAAAKNIAVRFDSMAGAETAVSSYRRLIG